MEQIKKLLTFPKPLLTVYPRVWIILFFVFVVVDLATKVWITDTLTYRVTEHQLENAVAGHVQMLVHGVGQINILGEEGKYIKLALVFNDRFVFGTGPAAPVFGLFLSLFAVIFLIFYRLHNPDFGPSAAWLLVFSGAVGNLIDKMFVKSLETGAWVFSLGPKPNHVSGVVDFVECIWFGWTPGYDMLSFSLPLLGTIRPLAWLAWPVWPLFNFADSLIVVGTCMLVFSMLFTKPQPEA